MSVCLAWGLNSLPTQVMHLTALQVLGINWFKSVSELPWQVGPAGQTAGTGASEIIGAVLRDEASDSATVVCIASWLFLRMGGFDGTYPVAYEADMISRLLMLGKVLVIQDADMAGVSLRLGEDLTTEWEIVSKSLPKAFAGQSESSLRGFIAADSTKKLQAGSCVRAKLKQAFDAAPRLQLSDALLEHLETPFPHQPSKSEMELDWGGEVDLQTASAMAFAHQARDFVQAASTWRPQPAAGVEGTMPIRTGIISSSGSRRSSNRVV